MKNREKQIVIVGGGFAGIRCALDLDKQKLPNTKVVLVSDRPHLEYHPALYRVVTGRSPLEVCIPLAEVFKNTNVEVVEDRIEKINLQESVITSETNSRYYFDQLVLTLGSRTAYFGIPGLEKNAFGFKSITQALKLKRHLHELFEKAKKTHQDETVSHIVVVGGGTSGVELAAELIIYTKKIAKKHGIDEKFVKVDLVEAKARLVAHSPPDVSELIQKRLETLGVNVIINTKVLKEDFEKIYLEHQEIPTKTLIWTGGVKGNKLYEGTKGFKLNKSGKVEVDKYLHPKGHSTVYIAGDGAATEYSGSAYTAIRHGKLIAKNIVSSLQKKPLEKLKEDVPPHAIPLGPGWAVVLMGGARYFGRIGWWMRRAADMRYFLSILPLGKALLAFSEGGTLCETCKICEPPQENVETRV